VRHEASHRPSSDIVKLFVQLSDEVKRDEPQRWCDEILRFCRQNLAPYNVPGEIEFLDAMPMTSLGKIDKRALRR